MHSPRLHIARTLVLGLLLLAACGPQPTATQSQGATPTPWPAVPPATVRDEAVRYITQAHPEIADGLTTADWKELPEPSVHTLAVYGFEAAGWQMWLTIWPAGLVERGGQPTEEDIYIIALKYTTPPPYILWEGEYAASSGVSENRLINREAAVEAIEADLARDQAFSYIAQAHAEVTAPAAAWSEPVVTGDGMGIARYTYTAGGWEITVSWDAYTATYNIYGTYTSTTADSHIRIEWQVEMSADGRELEEIDFAYQAGV